MPIPATRNVAAHHSQVPGLGRQVSGSGYQHQVQVRAIPYPYLNPNTRTWLPIAETRDLKIFPPPATCGRHPPLETLPSPLHFCTRLRRSCTFARQLCLSPCLYCAPLLPTGPLVNGSTNDAAISRATTSFVSYARPPHNTSDKDNKGAGSSTHRARSIRPPANRNRVG